MTGRSLIAVNALNVRPNTIDGSITFTLNVLRELPSARPDFRFAAFVRPGEHRLDDVAGLELVRVPAAASIAGRVAWETLLLGSAVRRRGARVLLAPYESVPLRLPCPTVVVAQNLFYHRDGLAEAFAGGTLLQRLATSARIRYYRARMPVAYARAAAVIAVSGETARLLQERAGLDPAKTTVVFEGSDSFLLPPRARGVGRPHRLLVVSGLMPYKNLDAAIEVLAQLRDRYPELVLEIAGGDWRGYRRHVEAHAALHGVAGALRLPGSVAPERMAELYASSDILLHLSDCESFGLPVLEAMRYGTAVVAANRSSLPEIAGGAAVLVDPDDVAGTAAAVSRVLDDETEQRRLAELGRARAAEITWRRTALGIGEVLERALA